MNLYARKFKIYYGDNVAIDSAATLFWKYSDKLNIIIWRLKSTTKSSPKDEAASEMGWQVKY